jgi:flagellar motor switch protein FliN/FliY
MLAESIGEAVADALSSATGSIVDLGKIGPFDPEAMIPGRPMPMRAIVVRFRRPLRDVMVFLTSHREEQVRPLIEAAASATIKALDVPTSADQHGPLGRFEIDPAIEFETVETALEQCDALYLEATYALELPTGELRLVVGTGLLQSAACFSAGIVDEFGTEPAYTPASNELELAGDIHADTISGDLELGSGEIGSDHTPTVELGATAAATAASGIDAYDAMLEAQERADEAAAAAAAVAETTAHTNIAAAELPDMAVEAATRRWTQLLSGVEVELSAELGRAELSLGDITSLASERVLTLDQLVHEPVCVYVNGTKYATAKLVVIDGEYGIEILEVVEQSSLIASLAA